MKNVAVFILILTISGCYNAKVTTGLEPSAKKIENSFASSWIYGLVPPKTVEAAEECNNGVAMVETKLSFVNMLVGNLTLGIYTPMTIEVTCASSSASVKLDNETDEYTVMTNRSENIIQDIQKASDEAVKTNNPVYIKLN